MRGDYLKLSVAFLSRCEGLSESELGRLVRAALHYKMQGALPTNLGREEFLFCELRKDIARETNIRNKRKAAGKQGADARWQNSKIEFCHKNDSKSDFCYPNDGKNEFCYKNDGKSEVCHSDIGVIEPSGEESIDNINNIYINNNINNTNLSTPKETIQEIPRDNPPPISPPKPKNTRILPPRFDEFWQAYPRKVAKEAALKAWTKLKPDDALAGVIIAAVRRKKESSQWTRDGGQYIPYPATFINGRRWEDEEEVLSTSPSPRFANLARLYQQYAEEERRTE